MIKNNDGHILIDTIISLIILSITLLNIYSLLIKSMKFDSKINKESSSIIIRSQEYDKVYKNLNKE